MCKTIDAHIELWVLWLSMTEWSHKSKQTFSLKEKIPFSSPLELTPPSITLTPSSRQVFSGECFTVHCSATQNNSTGWKLRHFSPGKSLRINQGKRFSTAGGAVGAKDSEKCVFRADQESSGLYWCEGGRGRSSSVNITVSCEYILTSAVMLKVLDQLLKM